MSAPVWFDSLRGRIAEIVARAATTIPKPGICLIRDLYGRVRVAAPADLEDQDEARAALRRFAEALEDALAAHACPAYNAVMFVRAERLAALRAESRQIAPRVFWVDRLLTGQDWWAVGGALPRPTRRYTLYSVKGGVGRSTTAAVLARHLAHKGEKVLIIDLDLESPGLSTALLDRSAQPPLGIVDWFVEDLVGQGEDVLEQMVATPSWREDFEGAVYIAPAHGMNPGEYLAKLGRAYMGSGGLWNERLRKLLNGLEERCAPTVVIVESRSGLHDIAAAAVMDIEAQVLLLGIDSESSWTDYGVLFRHWQAEGLASKIRKRLSIVSALTPAEKPLPYLAGFRQRSWEIFQHLYDSQMESGLSVPFRFDLNDTFAPHQPMPVYWHQGFAVGTSLRRLHEAAVQSAYMPFLQQFDQLVHETYTKAEDASR